MNHISRLVLSSALVMALAAWTALGDHGHQATSHGSDKGRTNAPQPVQKSGKQTSSPVKGHLDKGHKVSHPKNPAVPPAKSPPKHSWMKPFSGVGKNPNVSPGAKDAINTVVSGNFLSPAERQALTNEIAGNPANLNDDELKAVQAALDFDALAKREERYLKLENATGERLTVWLHYQTIGDKKDLEWHPTRPVDPEKALRYVLEPNATIYLGDGKNRIAAARARVWAESDSGRKWFAYRDADLKLKPTGRQAKREMGTYPLRLVGKEGTSEQASK